MFFEGSEKKVEMVVSGVNLRGLGKAYWEDVVRQCRAEMISSISNDHVDAYLLSESSLFVWGDRMVMITCGATVLMQSILKLVEDLGRERMDSLIFQRKNEYDQSKQKSSFLEDVRLLREMVPGKAHRFGRLDGHHHFIFNLDRPYRPAFKDMTSELLMYHVEGEAAQTLCHGGREKGEEIRALLGLEKREGLMVDDHFFKPCGYSANAIEGPRYITVHVTPQEDYSYVSYETSLDVEGGYRGLLGGLVRSLRPDSFDLVTFDADLKEGFEDGYFKWDHVKENLSCGYKTEFFHYVSVCYDPRAPQAL
ncbi:MAG: adenosylmethionine decarboxylase [Bacteriovoracales bacterium]|nr:adenosylmethionine decarboxylase [Bacteriovoracales bacterium]